MDRYSRNVAGFMAGILAAFLAFGLVYVAKVLVTCSCLSS